MEFPLARGTAQLSRRSTDIAPDIWFQAFGAHHKDFDYYQLIEDTLSDHFEFRYLLLLDRERNPVALQPLLIANQDLATSAPRAVQSLAAKLRKRWPRFLRSRMLMAGCLVGDGELGVIAPKIRSEAAELLIEALSQVARHEHSPLVTVKDFPASQRKDLQPLTRAGYVRLDGFPSLELPLNFASFDEYLEANVSKVTRKNLRRKLRQADQAEPFIEREVLSDASNVADEIYQLYLNVARKSTVSFEVFSRAYFLEAGLRMPGRFRYFIWRQAGRAIAFSFCTVWDGTIYDNDIGLDYAVAHDLNLYYVTFRDIIQWALAQGLKRYCTAPFNYEPKLRLGMRLVPVDIYVRHRSAIVNFALQRIAPLFAPAKSDPVLRPHYQ